MATTFMEPGGDATFDFTLFGSVVGSAAVVSDIVHGTHQRSIQCVAGGGNYALSPNATLGDAGSRISVWVYIKVASSAVGSLLNLRQSGANIAANLRITSASVLQLWNGTAAQIGSNGPTLSAGNWYRISLAYTITSTTVNRFEVNVYDATGTNKIGGISVTNATITNITTNHIALGNVSGNSTLDLRISDLYIDNSSALTDTGNIWVTDKRGFANGTTNGFTTQIGTGPVSGYGTGHAQQVNERALNTANGWSMVGAGAAVTEEYTIEGAAVGDIDVSTATIVDIGGWVYVKALAAETGQLVLVGVNHPISITTANAMFTAFAGSTTYPAGGTDVGLVTSTALTTVSLYECGVLVAYIPASGAVIVPHRSAGGGVASSPFGNY